jgi:hypothetical protein
VTVRDTYLAAMYYMVPTIDRATAGSQIPATVIVMGESIQGDIPALAIANTPINVEQLTCGKAESRILPNCVKVPVCVIVGTISQLVCTRI